MATNQSWTLQTTKQALDEYTQYMLWQQMLQVCF